MNVKKNFNKVDAINEMLIVMDRSDKWFNRYKNFLLFCLEYNKSEEPTIGGGYYEKHHILPVSLFGDYKKNKKNLIKLTGRQHFIAHFILAKMYGGGMLYAFNIMRRCGKTSILYNSFRKEFSQLQSELAKNHKWTEEQRRNHMAIMKDTVGVRDAEGNTFRVSIFDERYISGEFVFIISGRKHKESTKEKMSLNGNKGKKCYTDGEKDIYVKDGDDAPEGFYLGTNVKGKPKNSDKDVWCYNLETGKNIRISPNEEIPEGYVAGRNTDVGFSNINDYIKLVNDFKNFSMVSFKKDEPNPLPDFTYIRDTEYNNLPSIGGVKYIYSYGDILYCNPVTLKAYYKKVKGIRLIDRSLSVLEFRTKIRLDEVDLSKHKILSRRNSWFDE